MSTYFRTKAKHSHQDDNRNVKLVTSEYLVEAITWGEAETRTAELLEEIVHGTFTIKKVNDSPIENVIIDEKKQDKFWIVKIKYPSVDDNGKEKYIITQAVVTGNSIEDVLDQVHHQASEISLVDYEVSSVQLTKIQEFYPKEEEEEESTTIEVESWEQT